MVALTLGGCVAVGLQAPVGMPQGRLSLCGADRLLPLIGAPVAQLPLQPANRTVRIIRPGDAVTEDFSDRRLNVILDGGDRITAVSCG